MKTIQLKEETLTETLSQAERVLRSGGIIVGPTDTVYGIFCDATNEAAIKKIFELKQRPQEKALPIFVKDIATARRYTYIPDAKAKFLEKLWPGAVTVVFKHKEKLPKVLTGGLDTVGVRIPGHPFLLELLSRLDFPLAQTSANISGGNPARNFDEIKSCDFTRRRRTNMIIGGGELTGRASTVVDFTGKEPLILRSGFVTKEELDCLLQ
ncbi:MAG: threonylcarbamoyl-AMP synthase [Candidatus Sungbacteria bacterium RIFCSPHIGHO2_02_FULL_47_11]|uniref:L-threonylcarbamoyladenylate synthase n=1 Tax=Candidatus Sungbacteria bacterium RIFCSPHIGHO2_02_FULL_47_11 TaxID=1802270 RepID=A0A1G2KL30_9BACT|nr:MAG: threonylcarbamoyl-AMP synthase [Candidatus Sungbacteria bacterium RIFCSPHIGHO2_02_FULL_47_11]